MNFFLGRLAALFVLLGCLITGAEAQQIQCNASKTVAISTAADTQVVPAPPQGQAIYICDYEFSFNGTGNAYLESATTGTCGGSLVQIGNTWYGIANLGKVAPNPFYRGMTTGNLQLCVNTNANIAFSLTVYYAVQ